MGSQTKTTVTIPPVVGTGVKVVAAASALPLHSQLGASSAERWMNCPGSTALARAIGPTDDVDDPDYRRDGVMAHEIAALCLKDNVDCWEVMGGFPMLTSEMGAAVQVYLDFVRALPPGGQTFIEHRVHLPEFHPQFYGTVDFALVNRDKGVHVVDYKHGEGIAVEVTRNPQLMYYAYGFVAEDDQYSDEEWIKITIVQPRMPWHHDGIIRTWETKIGEVRHWAREVLRPAMEHAHEGGEFQLGEWCRFCPAKLLCPAMRQAVIEVNDNAAITELSEEELAYYYKRTAAVKMFIKAIDERVFRIMSDGKAGEALKAVAKLVRKRTDRVWKEGAPIEAVLGKAAWSEPKLVSPAVAEKLPGGKALVIEHAYKPEGGLSLVPIDDARLAVEVKTDDEKFPIAAQVGLDDMI